MLVSILTAGAIALLAVNYRCPQLFAQLSRSDKKRAMQTGRYLRALKIYTDVCRLFEDTFKRVDALKRTSSIEVWRPLELMIGDCHFNEIRRLGSELRSAHDAGDHSMVNECLTLLLFHRQSIHGLSEIVQAVATTSEQKRATSIATLASIRSDILLIANTDGMTNADKETRDAYTGFFEAIKDIIEPPADASDEAWQTFIRNVREADRLLESIKTRVAVTEAITEFKDIGDSLVVS